MQHNRVLTIFASAAGEIDPPESDCLVIQKAAKHEIHAIVMFIHDRHRPTEANNNKKSVWEHLMDQLAFASIVQQWFMCLWLVYGNGLTEMVTFTKPLMARVFEFALHTLIVVLQDNSQCREW